tara:strand:- start:7 stop:318 length:312 start_codon:yes stop_codon:yes gene_type:complete
MYYCYLIYSQSKNRCYIGITNNLDRRLDQHNQKLSGGAKSTKIAKDWEYKKVRQFNDKETAMSFEWYAKRCKNSNDKWVKISGLEKKIYRFINFEDLGGEIVL